jgi:Mlc titration factor MtfA (ptsG expression regulator)
MSWRRQLHQLSAHYRRLPQPFRGRFEDDLRIFLKEKRISGVGVEPSQQLRLAVAASAVTLSLGWPDYEWDQLGEVLLYPQEFNRDYSFAEPDGELAGEAHPWGTVILSTPALIDSCEPPEGGYHVGIHEFAHLLDVDQTHFDGIPVGMGGRQGRVWLAMMEKEMARLRRGASVLDPYGADDPVEFLAVAIEAFFQIPLRLRRRHREMYQLLAGYFGQDPAAWEEQARGLTG